MNVNGLITGVPTSIVSTTTYSFVVRATDNLQNIRDNTFSISISGISHPRFTTTPGPIPNPSPWSSTYPNSFLDSTWVEIPIQYENPILDNTVLIRVIAGSLPPGLEINEYGLIRGYASPPYINVNLPPVNTVATAVSNNIITCLNTGNFKVGRPVVFSGVSFGGIVPNSTYYINSVIDGTTFTVATTMNGPIATFTDAAGYMPTQLTTITQGQPTSETFNFVLKLESALGSDIQSYSISVVNQNTPVNQGGPGKGPNTRAPAIFNTRPETFQLDRNITEFGYYVLPPNEPIVTLATATVKANNSITVSSTAGFTVGNPVIFSGTALGTLISNTVYYVSSIISQTSFTVSLTEGGPAYKVTDDSGFMTVTLPFLSGTTYPLNNAAFIGTITSDNRLDFSILGHDFDGDQLQYNFSNLPLGLSGDTNTGWVTGNPVISANTVSSFSFSVSATKVVLGNPTSITSPTFTFSFKIVTDITGNVIWISPADLGTVMNGLPSMAYVKAKSDVDLLYRVVDGTLPPNLTLLPSGELSGIVAFQPGTSFQNAATTTPFTFTVQAYSTQFATVTSNQTFTLSVYQEFSNPTDILYIKCTPSIPDRTLLATLLDNDTLIPPDYLYRSDDPFFGKATSVIYEHAYGINASGIDEYLAAITKNHYWRQLTLGEIKTAVARNDMTGEILYEVVYSEVYDNLVNYNEMDSYQLESQSNIITPQGESVAKEIYWPRKIPLYLGPWYDSETNIFTSWNNTPDGQALFTSRTPGFVRTVYPNSLPNMRQQVVDVLGQTQNYEILPLWMTSQQRSGSTLGFTPAWVIAYCKPGVTTLPDGTAVSYAQYIQYQIQNNWKNTPGELQTLNTINFKIDRFSVNKSATYNYDNHLSPPAWTSLPSADPTPNPIDSQDFYVLFEQETILPGKTQY